MGRGRRRAATYSPSSSSSYSMESSSNHYHCTDLRLGLGFDETSDINEADLHTSSRTREQYLEQAAAHNYDQDEEEIENEESGSCNSLFVKVYMEGIPIGRKLNLLASNGYHDLISTLQLMFNFSNSSNTILWSGSGFGLDRQRDGHYDFVLTYQDKEGDWMMVGDVPWEMFLSTVKRLKIIRPYQYS